MWRKPQPVEPQASSGPASEPALSLELPLRPLGEGELGRLAGGGSKPGATGEG